MSAQSILPDIGTKVLQELSVQTQEVHEPWHFAWKQYYIW